MSGYWETIRPCLPALLVPRDEWVGRMMAWHFSDRTGSPFWLDARASFNFDPRRDVQTFDDLALFGPFDSDRLRTARTSDLIPRGFRAQPHRLFETGGTTGTPTRIVDAVRGKYDAAIYEAFLRARGHAPAGDVLAMTPSGPHAYGWFVTRLADRWTGSVFIIDFDPRWFKKIASDSVQSGAYLTHLIDQADLILKRNRVKFLFTTSKLLLRSCIAWARPIRELGIEIVCTGGTSCTAEEEALLREFYLQDVDWIDTYGNTLVGHALQSDPEADDETQTKSYHLPPPLGFLAVTDHADWQRQVDYGERGRVMITTLLDDLFIPNMLERDSAVRSPPTRHFPWDGVSAVEPLWQTDATSEVAGVEGVY